MGLVAPSWSGGERSEPERSEGATSPETPADIPKVAAPTAPDPQVSAKAVRRQFTAAYKRRILQQADQYGPGGIAALLRREGLYSSHLTSWRKQREAGEIAGLEPRKRGKKPAPRNPLAGEVQRLRRDNAWLQKRLRQAETIIEVQKKLCDVLGLTVPEHRHGGIGLMTPAAVHHGRVEAVTQVRKAALSEAFKQHPEHFVRGMPRPPAMPEAAWINKPKTKTSRAEDRTLAETELIPGVLGYGPSKDRPSWAILEASSLDRAAQQTGNDINFDS